MKIFTNGSDIFATDTYIKNLTQHEIYSISYALKHGICPFALLGVHDMTINRFDELTPWDADQPTPRDPRSSKEPFKIDFTKDMDSIDILIELIKNKSISEMLTLGELENKCERIFKSVICESPTTDKTLKYIFESWKNRKVTIKITEDHELSYTLTEPENQNSLDSEANQNSLDSEAKHLRALTNSKKITEREICAIYKVDNLEDGDKSTLSQTEIETLKFKEETLDKLERAIKVVGIQRERRENK